MPWIGNGVKRSATVKAVSASTLATYTGQKPRRGSTPRRTRFNPSSRFVNTYMPKKSSTCSTPEKLMW